MQSDTLFFITPSADHLRRGLEALQAKIGAWEPFRFADGERGYHLGSPVKGELVAVVGSVTPDPGSLFDIIALTDLLSENGAQRPILILPYLGYARQDRPVHAGDGRLGVVVANLLRDLKPARIVVLDVHSPGVRAALGAVAVEASAIELFVRHLMSSAAIDTVVAPDRGARERTRMIAARFTPNAKVAEIEKTRPRANLARAIRLEGDVAGRHVLIIDDMIDTGGTLCEAVRLVVSGGAASVRVAATHGIFSEGARERVLSLPVDQIIVTNSLRQAEHPRIEVLDVVPILLAGLEQFMRDRNL